MLIRNTKMLACLFYNFSSHILLNLCKAILGQDTLVLR
jgi:hypothetical protein